MKRLFLALVAFIPGTLALGQDIASNTAGFSISLAPAYASWSSESLFLGTLDDEEPNGYGMNIKVAYGINQRIEVFIAYGFEGFAQELDWDTYRHQAFDFGARFNFGATLKKWRPFLEGALTRNDLSIDPIVFDGTGQLFKLNVKGLSGTVGAGVHYFLNTNFSLNVCGKGSFGDFNEIYLTGERIDGLGETLDFQFFRIHLGASYFFE